MLHAPCVVYSSSMIHAVALVRDLLDRGEESAGTARRAAADSAEIVAPGSLREEADHEAGADRGGILGVELPGSDRRRLRRTLWSLALIELALPALAVGFGLVVERGHWSLYGAAGVTASLVVAYLFRHLVPLSRIEVVGQPATD